MVKYVSQNIPTLCLSWVSEEFHVPVVSAKKLSRTQRTQLNPYLRKDTVNTLTPFCPFAPRNSNLNARAMVKRLKSFQNNR